MLSETIWIYVNKHVIALQKSTALKKKIPNIAALRRQRQRISVSYRTAESDPFSKNKKEKRKEKKNLQ